MYVPEYNTDNHLTYMNSYNITCQLHMTNIYTILLFIRRHRPKIK